MSVEAKERHELTRPRFLRTNPDRFLVQKLLVVIIIPLLHGAYACAESVNQAEPNCRRPDYYNNGCLSDLGLSLIKAGLAAAAGFDSNDSPNSLAASLSVQLACEQYDTLRNESTEVRSTMTKLSCPKVSWASADLMPPAIIKYSARPTRENSFRWAVDIWFIAPSALETTTVKASLNLSTVLPNRCPYDQIGRSLVTWIDMTDQTRSLPSNFRVSRYWMASSASSRETKFAAQESGGQTPNCLISMIVSPKP